MKRRADPQRFDDDVDRLQLRGDRVERFGVAGDHRARRAVDRSDARAISIRRHHRSELGRVGEDRRHRPVQRGDEPSAFGDQTRAVFERHHPGDDRGGVLAPAVPNERGRLHAPALPQA